MRMHTKPCALGSLAFSFVLASPAPGNSCDARATSLAADAEKATEPVQMARIAREALALCPSSARAHNALGTSLEKQGKPEAAADAYRKAAELDPKWALPWFGLGDLARARGDVAAARTQYLEALRRARTDQERAEAAAELEKLGGGGDYSFKSSRSIAEALKVGAPAVPGRTRGQKVRPADPAEETFADEGGIAVNFSIPFDVSSSRVRPDARPQLDEIGRALKGARPSERYLVEGHASSEGKPEFNRTLSQQRSEAVVAYLVREHGVDRAVLSAAGRGSEKPVLEAGQENRVKSRRVTVVRLYEQ